MLQNSGWRTAFPAILSATAVLAWGGPQPESGRPSVEEVDCTFAIRGSNNLAQDVWVYLYDSYVLNATLVTNRPKQLLIQNHRIAPGKSMDRRFTASGRCSANRHWTVKVKKGADTFTMKRYTGGNLSDSRTVDLGPASRWRSSD